MDKDNVPETEEEYIGWAKNVLGIDFEEDFQKETYRIGSTLILSAVKDVFDRRLETFLIRCAEEYFKKKQSQLFMSVPEVEWDRKEYSSVVNKSFRYNVVGNSDFPSPPSYNWVKPDDWMKPNNWFLRLNDVVRTNLVCKYIDGPRYLVEKLALFIKNQLKLDCRHSSRQNDSGYYAYHLYAKVPVVLYIGSTIEHAKVDTEIQITTQLQDVLSQVTHHYYEETRVRKNSDPSLWKWEIDTNRFRIGYLSHTLHLLEAIILEARDKSLLERKSRGKHV